MNLPLTRTIGRALARFLSQPSKRALSVATSSPEKLKATLKKGDVLLVDGTSRFSVAIKYLTQSTWSHAALYIGPQNEGDSSGNQENSLVEADVNEGVRLAPLSLYHHKHTRICRPVGLDETEIDQLVEYTISRVGNQYDLKNIFDLARFLIQKPPVPNHWRRRLLAIGSGDPTRAICSSLIAQAYHSVKYPILPEISLEQSMDPEKRGRYEEYLHIRHHSLFAPGDFDVSPYFRVVKPTIESGFDPHELNWSEESEIGKLNSN